MLIAWLNEWMHRFDADSLTAVFLAFGAIHASNEQSTMHNEWINEWIDSTVDGLVVLISTRFSVRDLKDSLQGEWSMRQWSLIDWLTGWLAQITPGAREFCAMIDSLMHEIDSSNWLEFNDLLGWFNAFNDWLTDWLRGEWRPRSVRRCGCRWLQVTGRARARAHNLLELTISLC